MNKLDLALVAVLVLWDDFRNAFLSFLYGADVMVLVLLLALLYYWKHFTKAFSGFADSLKGILPFQQPT